MKSATLHRLLWGVGSPGPVDQWAIRAWEVPAVGLPSRVASFLFVNRRKHCIPSGWEPRQGPLTWECQGNLSTLRAGRRSQFGLKSNWTMSDLIELAYPGQFSVKASMKWEVPAHGAYYLPFTTRDHRGLHKSSYALYCDVLLLLTAMDGGEGILHQLVDRGRRHREVRRSLGLAFAYSPSIGHMAGDRTRDPMG